MSHLYVFPFGQLAESCVLAASKRAAGLIKPDGVAAKMKISNNEAMVTPKST